MSRADVRLWARGYFTAQDDAAAFESLSASASAAIEEILKEQSALQQRAGAGQKVVSLFESRKYGDEPRSWAITNRLIQGARRGDIVMVAAMIDGGVPPSAKHDKTGDTVLHAAAACNAVEVVRFLIQLPDCDYNIRNNKGYRASDTAYLYGRNSALARLLSMKERKQANK